MLTSLLRRLWVWWTEPVRVAGDNWPSPPALKKTAIEKAEFATRMVNGTLYAFGFVIVLSTIIAGFVESITQGLIAIAVFGLFAWVTYWIWQSFASVDEERDRLPAEPPHINCVDRGYQPRHDGPLDPKKLKPPRGGSAVQRHDRTPGRC